MIVRLTIACPSLWTTNYRWSHDPFQNFGPPLISLKRMKLKLDISNLVWVMVKVRVRGRVGVQIAVLLDA